MIEKLKTLFNGEIWLLWIVAAFFLQAMQSAFVRDNTRLHIAVLVGYALCVLMFLRHLKIRQVDRMADIEMLSMDFLQECRKAGRGQFRYFVPYTHTDRTKRWYAKWFKKTYLRVYEASFFDDGVQGFKAHKIIPVNDKQLFEMKLRGMVDTENRKHADAALVYLGITWPIP